MIDRRHRVPRKGRARRAKGFSRVLALTVMSLALPLRAATVSLQVSPTRISIADRFQIRVTVQNAEAKIQWPTIEEDGFQIVSGPSVSQQTRVTVSGGRRVRLETATQTYEARPTRTGEIILPPVAVQVGDETIQSSGPKRLQVTELPEHEDFFLELEADKTRVYRDEKLTLRLKIYARELEGRRYRGVPPFASRGARWPHLSIPWFEGKEGFASEEFQVYANSLQPTLSGDGFPINNYARQRIFDSEPYLFPLDVAKARRPGPSGQTANYFVYTLEKTFEARQLGRHTFAPVTARGHVFVGTPGADPKPEPRVAQSNAVTVEVLDVPQRGRPASYSGAVGSRFAVSAEVIPKQAWVGSPLTLKLRVRGDGKLDSIGPVSLKAQEAFEKDFRIHTEPQTGVEQPDGSKVFTYGLRPTHADIEAIPPIAFSYFDPRKERFETVHTEALAITVEEGEGREVVTYDESDATRRHEAVERPLYPVYEKPDALEVQRLKIGLGPVELTALAAPPVAYLFLLLFLARRRRHGEDPSIRRAKQASRAARRAMAEARGALADGEVTASCGALARALTAFVADRTRRPAAGMTPQDVLDVLRQREVSGELQDELRDILDLCEQARYGAPPPLEALPAVIDRAERCLGSLNRELKG